MNEGWREGRLGRLLLAVAVCRVRRHTNYMADLRRRVLERRDVAVQVDMVAQLYG